MKNSLAFGGMTPEANMIHLHFIRYFLDFLETYFNNSAQLYKQRPLCDCQESAAAYKDLDLRGFDPGAPDSDDDPISDIED